MHPARPPPVRGRHNFETMHKQRKKMGDLVCLDSRVRSESLRFPPGSPFSSRPNPASGLEYDTDELGFLNADRASPPPRRRQRSEGDENRSGRRGNGVSEGSPRQSMGRPMKLSRGGTCPRNRTRASVRSDEGASLFEREPFQPGSAWMHVLEAGAEHSTSEFRHKTNQQRMTVDSSTCYI